jgi:hypothetical protein
MNTAISPAEMWLISKVPSDLALGGSSPCVRLDRNSSRVHLGGNFCINQRSGNSSLYLVGTHPRRRKELWREPSLCACERTSTSAPGLLIGQTVQYIPARKVRPTFFSFIATRECGYEIKLPPILFLKPADVSQFRSRHSGSRTPRMDLAR